jgi:transposase
MQGTVSKYRVALKRKQRRWLQAVVRRRTPSHWLVVRAKVILLAASRWSIQDIGAALSLDRQVVRRWCKRFRQGGVHSLRDRPRAGRCAVIEPKVWQKVATVVVQPPTKFGLELPRWSLRELSLFLGKRFGWKVSRSSLSRFLRSMALKPHRIKYWLNPTDPDFDEKAAVICRLYLDPPPRTVLLSIDEKPGVQARSRKHPTIPMAPGRPARVEFEYKRHGTRNVFAAFNVRTGHVLVEVTADRKVPRVLAFLNLICATYRRGRIVIVTDNINTRKGPDAQAWLASHPRVAFVFTPFHGSWLNQVEIWFSILTSKCLRGRAFGSVAELAAAIKRFAGHWNRDMAHAFEWTYTGKVLHA